MFRQQMKRNALVNEPQGLNFASFRIGKLNFKMTNLKKYLVLLLVGVLAFSCTQPKQDDKLKILFIGNSYTYYNSTPEVVKALLQERFPKQEVETQLISGGGMTLADHWKNESTLESIQSGAWDYVVLQEQSKLGMGLVIDNKTYFGPTDLFFEHARKFDAAIKEAGAETVFLMTWSVRDQPEEQAILSHAYSTIAKELDAMVAPVGLVWDEVRTNPSISLYADDGGHPSPAGSYLSAITLYATLMEDNPKGLSESISGARLSSTGERISDKELLVELSAEDAQLIQESSWDVVDAMLKSDDYLDFEKPAPNYTIPTLDNGETLELDKITGKWYGSGSYGSEYLGQSMEIQSNNGQAEVSLSFFSPHGKDVMQVQDVTIEGDQLRFKLYDALRSRSADVSISFNKDKMKGLLVTSGNFKRYTQLDFSKTPIVDALDLSALEAIQDTFESNIGRIGYTNAAVKYYNQYSDLIGKSYKPEAFYLNAVGYNFLQEKRIDDALNIFELAIHYYPDSVNPYDSYAEALVLAGRKEEALLILSEALELAKRTNYKDIAYIKEHLNRLKKNDPVKKEESNAMPPPPPPPPPSSMPPPPPPPPGK